MIAHVARFDGTAGQLAGATAALETEVYPELARMGGFVQSLFLARRESGEALLITLWESEGHVAAAEDRWRELGSSRGALEETGGRRTALGQFDVALRTGPEGR